VLQVEVLYCDVLGQPLPEVQPLCRLEEELPSGRSRPHSWGRSNQPPLKKHSTH
jgi:hypothetical protein